MSYDWPFDIKPPVFAFENEIQCYKISSFTSHLKVEVCSKFALQIIKPFGSKPAFYDDFVQVQEAKLPSYSLSIQQIPGSKRG